MSHYDFPAEFRALYERALQQYEAGTRQPDELINAQERQFLAANGISPRHIFDYAEDQFGEGEPGYDHAFAIETVRRDYFLNVQGGVASQRQIDPACLPKKSDPVKGIEWLPRIIPKARAKLRGELPASMMYCCGGDRQFFKEHDLFPAEFLSLVWRHENDDSAIVEWVVRRSGTRARRFAL